MLNSQIPFSPVLSANILFWILVQYSFFFFGEPSWIQGLYSWPILVPKTWCWGERSRKTRYIPAGQSSRSILQVEKLLGKPGAGVLKFQRTSESLGGLVSTQVVESLLESAQVAVVSRDLQARLGARQYLENLVDTRWETPLKLIWGR